MRAAIVDEFGPLEAIRIGETPAPELKPGHLLIAVKAAGVGFVDVLGAQGKYQVKQTLPFVPGSEYAGIVEAVGEGVTAIAPGERVMAGGFAGAYADYALAPAGAVLAMPAAMSFVEAAGFRTNYATALHALADRAAITPGELLLVLGAAAAQASRRSRSASCWARVSSPRPRRRRNVRRRSPPGRTKRSTMSIPPGARR